MKKIIFFLIIFLFLACDPNELKIYSIEYKVTGSASRVDVTYANDSGGTSQQSNVRVPWSYSFNRIKGSFVYISAQNQGESGSVIVTIYKENELFKRSESNGAYVIASASGRL